MNQFIENPYNYQRFKTRIVKIGNTALGGDNPIRIQSMTNTDTMNTDATVAQSIRMIEAGCEYVRITAPGVKEAENLANIKNELLKLKIINTKIRPAGIPISLRFADSNNILSIMIEKY